MVETSCCFSHLFNTEKVEDESEQSIDRIPEDVLFNILFRLEDDPRHLARLACVCRRLSIVIRSSCWKICCMKLLPALIPELLQSSREPLNELEEPPGGWSSLQKLLVCCPGLWHAGVLSETSDFSVDQETESAVDYKLDETSQKLTENFEAVKNCVVPPFQRICFRNLNASSETAENAVDDSTGACKQPRFRIFPLSHGLVLEKPEKKRRLIQEGPHLSLGVSTLSREQGTKLLASRFRADILYICDWSSCVHKREGRQYKLFRGVFKNFKGTHVWRNLNELKAKKVNVCCAFCLSTSIWDMVTSFCLRRSFDYHDDGEPVVRAFVCENGHVAGAWTDRPTHKF